MRCDTPYNARGPKGFAFIEYEDERDAEDALRATNGMRLCGFKINVEVCLPLFFVCVCALFDMHGWRSSPRANRPASGEWASSLSPRQLVRT